MNMIEKVAKAIYEKRNGAGFRPWSRQSGAYQKPYLDDARAAIEAMREPTPNMIADERIYYGMCHTCGGLKDGYRIMIEEALK